MMKKISWSLSRVNYDFEWINLSELKKILKSLMLYKDLYVKLWNRWKKLFSSISSWKSIYRIEYFDAINEKEALEEGLIAYKKVFWYSPNREDISLEKKKSLIWGIRIYKDDNMVDLSFKKVENILI